MRYLSVFTCLLFSLSVFSQKSGNLVERLGYPAGSKLLIIHSDDLAVSHAENQASMEAMETGSVRSASVMVPCPWLPEVADYARKHPGHDMGLHLTLTSEWWPYKWGPVAPRGQVSSLVDSNGYFYHNCAAFGMKAKPEEVERELRAQIEKSKAMGLEPTHFDSHMGCLFYSSPELFSIYLKMGRIYGVPSMVSHDFLDAVSEDFRKAVTDRDIVVDRVITASPEDYTKGMEQYYLNMLGHLQPGVNVLLIHTAYETDDMRRMTDGFPGAWDAGWRQADYNFFSSELCKKVLKDQNIQLITWKQIGNLLKP